MFPSPHYRGCDRDFENWDQVLKFAQSFHPLIIGAVIATQFTKNPVFFTLFSFHPLIIGAVIATSGEFLPVIALWGVCFHPLIIGAVIATDLRSAYRLSKVTV